MKFEYTFDNKEYQEINKYFAKKKTGVFVGYLLLALVPAASLIGVAQHLSNETLKLLSYVIGAAVIIALTILMNMGMHKAPKELGQGGIKISFDIDEAKFIIDSRIFKTEIKKGAIQDVEENDKYFFMKLLDGKYIVVPKSSSTDTAQLSSLINNFKA